MALLWLHEIWHVKWHPEEYAPLWGSEGPVAGLWYYASETAYITNLLILLLWFLIGALLCLNRGIFRHPRLLIAHVFLSLLWIIYNLLNPL